MQGKKKSENTQKYNENNTSDKKYEERPYFQRICSTLFYTN